MSNRTLVEINHDFCPSNNDEALLDWARMIRDYCRSGNPKDLPAGVTFLQTRHHSDGCPVQTLRHIRNGGWSVAVHNDYRDKRGNHTFWLFTHENGRFVKGEGPTDAEACKQALEKILAL